IKTTPEIATRPASRDGRAHPDGERRDPREPPGREGLPPEARESPIPPGRADPPRKPPAGAEDPGGDGPPLAAMETYFAVRKQKAHGAGETNVPVRGVQPESFELRDGLKIVQGREFKFGSDEVIVGRKLIDRMAGCNVDDVIQLNLTPFRVVGIFEGPGACESEIWGDFKRMSVALQIPWANSILAKLKPGADFKALEP